MIRRRFGALAVGGVIVAAGVLGGAQAASASAGPAATASRPAGAATTVVPYSNYQNCMLRVDVPYTTVVAGSNVYDLDEGSELYSTDQQDTSQNLWWLYSLQLGRYVWVDWHDIALEYCDP